MNFMFSFVFDGAHLRNPFVCHIRKRALFHHNVAMSSLLCDQVLFCLP